MCNFSFAQKDSITISGKITDARTGLGIPFAYVSFSHIIKSKKSRKVETFESLQTDFEGYYSTEVKYSNDSIQNTYSMTIQYIGYITKKSEKFTIQKDSKLIQNFILQEDSNYNWEPREVIMSCPSYLLPRTGQSGGTFSGEQIRNMGIK